jgi:hypothetical protein
MPIIAASEAFRREKGSRRLPANFLILFLQIQEFPLQLWSNLTLFLLLFHFLQLVLEFLLLLDERCT